jgi:hypothetical protein
MSARPSNLSDSHLDSLIARIHGLAGSLDSSKPPAPSGSALSGSAAGSSAASAAAADISAKSPRGEPVALPASVASAIAATKNADPTIAELMGRVVAPRGAHVAPRSTSVAPEEFQPNRDEPWRPMEPDSFEAAGVREAALEQLVLRFMLARGEVEGRQVADQVKMPFRLMEPMLARLKMDQLVAHRRGSAAGDYVYVLTETGRNLARGYAAECTYYGAAPVPLAKYIESIKLQTVEGQKPQKEDLERAFSDLLINPRMLDRLGPAVNSGRGMFLFGYPGNGKTSIAERVTAAFGKYIWIPRAIDVDGDILRVYDRMNHESRMPEGAGGWLDHSAYDKRWVRIKRPTIIAGGELTMDMLEVQCNTTTNISEAPLQMKSNCGTLVIDDFGRQKISVDQLLNRWIVPLEKRFDFLNMRSGKKIQVPFDQLVIFSTNLEPKDLVDDAFLRRIPYKIEVCDPAEVDFRKLFEIMCGVLQIPYRSEAVDYVIEQHYRPTSRPFRNCQPRDLLLQVRNYCLYQGLPVELKNEYFDFAVEVYFSIM